MGIQAQFAFGSSSNHVSGSSPQTLDSGTIAGVVIGSLLGLSICIVIVVLLIRKCCHRCKEKRRMQAVSNTLRLGDRVPQVELLLHQLRNEQHHLSPATLVVVNEEQASDLRSQLSFPYRLGNDFTNQTLRVTEGNILDRAASPRAHGRGDRSNLQENSIPTISATVENLGLATDPYEGAQDPDVLEILTVEGPWLLLRTLRPAIPEVSLLPLFIEETRMQLVDDVGGQVIHLIPRLLLYRFREFVFITSGTMPELVMTAMVLSLTAETGPPPAENSRIQALPTLAITQTQVDCGLRCNICFDDFLITESGRQLPCNHYFHSDCIIPWLRTNGTCPVCRESVNHHSSTGAALRLPRPEDQGSTVLEDTAETWQGVPIELPDNIELNNILHSLEQQ